MAETLKSKKQQPSVWKNCRVEDFCTTASGGTPLTTRRDYYDDGHIPWLRSGEVSQGRVRHAEISITQAGLDNSSAKLFKKGTILVAMYGATAGEVGILEFESSTNQAVCGITPGPSVDGEFLFQALLLNKPTLIKMAGGGAQPNISQEIIRNFKIPLPPLAEQRKIAEILRAWDEAIETAEAELKAKQERKRWLATEVFSTFSKGSKALKLSDIVDRLTKAADNPEKYEVLSISSGRGFELQREKYSRVIAGKQIAKYVLLSRGDFSYNKGNSLRYPVGCVYQLNEFSEGLVPNVFCSFRVIGDKCDAGYIRHYFSLGMHNEEVMKRVNMGVRNNGLLNITPDQFFGITIKIPPLGAQRKIAEFLDLHDEEEVALTKRIGSLRTQKRGLMQKLLTGEVRVAA